MGEEDFYLPLEVARSTTGLFNSSDGTPQRTASGTVVLSHKQRTGLCYSFTHSAKVMVKHSYAFATCLSIGPPSNAPTYLIG